MTAWTTTAIQGVCDSALRRAAARKKRPSVAIAYAMRGPTSTFALRHPKIETSMMPATTSLPFAPKSTLPAAKPTGGPWSLAESAFIPSA